MLEPVSIDRVPDTLATPVPEALPDWMTTLLLGVLAAVVLPEFTLAALKARGTLVSWNRGVISASSGVQVVPKLQEVVP